MAERKYPSVYRVQYTNRLGAHVLSKTYFINYVVRGKRVREATGLTSAKAAYEILLQRKQELRTGRLIRPNASKVTIATLERLVVDDYSTRGFRTTEKVIRRRCKPLHAYFSEARAMDITAADLTAYVAYRRTVISARGKPVTLGTISLELAHLQRGFSIAVKSKLLPEAPEFPRLKLNSARRVPIDLAALRVLLQHLPEDRRPIFWVGMLTGWRKEAVLSRRRSDASFVEGTLHLDGRWSKNGRPVVVAMGAPGDTLRTMLEAQDKRAGELEQRTGRIIPWLFFYWKDSPNNRAGDRVIDFDAAFDKAKKAAGLDHITFHSLRYGAVRLMRASGSSEHEIMERIGVVTRSIFDHYDVIDRERQEGTAARLEAFLQEDLARAPVLASFRKP